MGWSAYREIHRRALIATFAATVALSGAAPALALAETTDQQTNQAAAQATAASDATAQATDATAAEADATAEEVGATVTLADGTTTENFDWIVHAVDAINNDTTGKYVGATLTIQKSVVTHPAYTFNKKITFTSASKDYSFDGTLVFQGAAANGSKVENVTFARGEAREGNINSVTVDGASDVTVSGCTFNAPSALFQGKEWQYNGVLAKGKVSGLEISNNQFNLGRMNDTNGSGTVAADANANSGINLVGGGDGNIDGVTIKNNVLTVTAANSAASRDASVNLLIANGNNTKGGYGIKNLTVTGNQYDGKADASNTVTRFAGISNVEVATFSGNTIKNAARGIGQSVWGNTTQSNKDVTSSGNTFENVTSEGEYANEETVARVTVDGVTTPYETLAEAVAAANKQDGAKVELFKSVTDHSSITFTKKVEVVAANKQVTFNGSMRLSGSGSTVSGVHFVLDGDDLTFADGKVSGVKQSVILSNHAEGIEISGNIFDLPSLDKGDVDFQLSSVWLEQGVSGSKITGNEFNLGRAYNNSNVGINFVGAAKTVIRDTTVSDNKVTFTADKYSADHANSSSGSVFFVIANGNRKGANDTDYGIDGVTAEGNKIDGTAVSVKDFGVGISNVKNATFTGNEITGTYMAVSPSYYPAGKTYASTGLSLKRNTLKDNTANVYFDPLFSTGDMKADDISYGGGTDANKVAISDYTGSRTPYVSGLAFAGWYADESFTTPATKDTAEAYAKFVSISDVVKFMGGSLNMDAYKKTDGTTDYTKTDLRFGFNVVAPNSEQKLDSWKWVTTYTKLDGTEKTLETEGKNFRKPYTAEAGKGYSDGIVTNLLLTGIQSTGYASEFTTTLSVTYTTPDGTQATVTDSPQTRSVKGVADAIKGSNTASDAERAYADGILGETKSN